MLIPFLPGGKQLLFGRKFYLRSQELKSFERLETSQKQETEVNSIHEKVGDIGRNAKQEKQAGFHRIRPTTKTQ